MKIILIGLLASFMISMLGVIILFHVNIWLGFAIVFVGVFHMLFYLNQKDMA